MELAVAALLLSLSGCSISTLIIKNLKSSGIIQSRNNGNQGSIAQLDDATIIDNQLCPSEGFGDHSTLNEGKCLASNQIKGQLKWKIDLSLYARLVVVK